MSQKKSTRAEVEAKMRLLWNQFNEVDDRLTSIKKEMDEVKETLIYCDNCKRWMSYNVFTDEGVQKLLPYCFPCSTERRRINGLIKVPKPNEVPKPKA